MEVTISFVITGGAALIGGAVSSVILGPAVPGMGVREEVCLWQPVAAKTIARPNARKCVNLIVFMFRRVQTAAGPCGVASRIPKPGAILDIFCLPVKHRQQSDWVAEAFSRRPGRSATHRRSKVESMA